MKKTFNYNLKNRFKTSVLLSALSVGTLVGNVSCTPPQRKTVDSIKKTENVIKVDIKELDSLYNDIIITALDIAADNNTDKELRNIIRNTLLYDEKYGYYVGGDNYYAILKLYSSISDMKTQNIISVRDLLKECSQYIWLSRKINEKKLTDSSTKSR